MEENEPKKTEVKRNPDGTFAEGTAPGPGRNTGQTLKSYLAQKLRNMSAEEKEAWLNEFKVSGEIRWKMAEGNPEQGIDLQATQKLEEIEKIVFDNQNKQ